MVKKKKKIHEPNDLILLCLCVLVPLTRHTVTTNRNPQTDGNVLWFVFSSGVFSDGNVTYGIEPFEGGEVSLDFTSFNKHKL